MHTSTLSFPYVRFLLVTAYGIEVFEDLAVALTRVPATAEWTLRRQIVAGLRPDAAGQTGPLIAEDTVVAASLPAVPPDGYVRVSVAGQVFDAPRDVARAAGWCAYADRLTGTWEDGMGAQASAARAMQALSEGYTGTMALLRAVAIREAETQARLGLEEADRRLHAARVERQAAMLRCRAAGQPETYPS